MEDVAAMRASTPRGAVLSTTLNQRPSPPGVSHFSARRDSETAHTFSLVLA